MDLGLAWADAAAVGKLRLEKPLHYRRAELAALLLPDPQGQHLQRHIKPRSLIVAAIHRSRLVADYLATTRGRVRAEHLPAYAPECNPMEYMWAHLKSHEIANLITTETWELSFEATAALRKLRRRTSIIAACFSQVELWP